MRCIIYATREKEIFSDDVAGDVPWADWMNRICATITFLGDLACI